WAAERGGSAAERGGSAAERGGSAAERGGSAAERGGSAAQIGIDHLPMRADFGGRPSRQHLAEIEHGHMMADVEDQIGMMLDHEDAGAGSGDRRQQPREPLALPRPEPRPPLGPQPG